jgi:hypothetical protein
MGSALTLQAKPDGKRDCMTKRHRPPRQQGRKLMALAKQYF